jgi:hypothetical protein
MSPGASAARRSATLHSVRRAPRSRNAPIRFEYSRVGMRVPWLMSSPIWRALKPPTVGDVNPMAIPRAASSSSSGRVSPGPGGRNAITACGRAHAGAAPQVTASAQTSAPATRIRIRHTL